MDIASDPKTITASGIPRDSEKVVGEPIAPLAEGDEKATESTVTSSASPPPVKTDNHNEPPPLAAESLIFPDDFTEAPPPLPFSCWDHKFSIGVFWFFILAEVCFIPESFYYGLWFSTTLNHGACKSSIHSPKTLPDPNTLIPQYSPL
jgi:hypothetical protein